MNRPRMDAGKVRAGCAAKGGIDAHPVQLKMNLI